jgi:hypothetical protein
MSNNATDAEVFVYTGDGGAEIPKDVVRVRVDPSIASITARAFNQRMKLAKVEPCEGVVEIGEHSFSGCHHSIMKINIPTSLRRIKNYAFSLSLRCPICLHDDIESIGEGAFAYCIFTNFRVPPLITVIPERMLYECLSIFSLEFPEDITGIRSGAFHNCYCLRNVAFPLNADIGDNIFAGRRDATEQYDLQLLFRSDIEAIRELQHRFDGLLIHRILYYQSYHEGVLQNLAAIQLDATGNQQDCLGMTPLHILACSSAHNIEVYHLIVEKYPTNLITEDRWGTLPLLYAFWGAAPAEIIQFLLESYQSLYPDHVLNWTMMVEMMGRTDTPKESIENLLCVKQMHFPDQPIDWEYLFGKFTQPSDFSFSTLFSERVKFLVMCGLSMRVEDLAFNVWRDYIKNMVHTAEFQYNEQFDNKNIIRIRNQHVIRRIQARVAHFEEVLPKLKEITTLLELALWKFRMNENILQGEPTHCQKKVKTDESSIRRQCRITCGANVVIRHMLPFLLLSIANI